MSQPLYESIYISNNSVYFGKQWMLNILAVNSN